MSYIQRSTVEDLVKRVGYKLDMRPDGSSLPEDVHVKQWLQDACLRMLDILPLEALAEFFVQSSVTIGVSGRGSVAGLPILRLVAVRYNGQSCTTMPNDEFQTTIRRAPSLYSHLFPAATIVGTATGAALEVYPAVQGGAAVYYVAEPRPIADWDNDDSSPWNMLLPPASWEEAMVDYAVIQAKIQDEEIGQAQQLIQAWQEQVAAKMQGNLK